MTTRFTAKPGTTFGVTPLPTGLNNVSVPSNLTIPPVGLEDVDTGLFNLFSKEMKLAVKTDTGIKSVPIIFASGEKWAMLKKGRALRDKTGSLILPLITMGRNNVQQNFNEDQAGRGINQQTGEIVIKRRLGSSDRAYQDLVNHALIKNQENVAVNPGDDPILNQVTTGRDVGSLANDPTIQAGGLLASNKTDNVWEIIVVPSPQFFTAVYEVTIWTSYTEHMNQILEGLISSFLPQGNAWRLETTKGYWFVATVDGNLYSSENNFDDMSSEERIIKYKFTVKVPGYILASQTPGASVPLRRYVSSPGISFGISTGGVAAAVDDPFLGADDPTLPLADGNVKNRDQRFDGKTKLYPNADAVSPHDPARASLARGTNPAQYRRVIGVDRKGNQVVRYIRIKSVNKFSGEMIYAPTDLSDLSIIVVDD